MYLVWQFDCRFFNIERPGSGRLIKVVMPTTRSALEHAGEELITRGREERAAAGGLCGRQCRGQRVPGDPGAAVMDAMKVGVEYGRGGPSG